MLNLTSLIGPVSNLVGGYFKNKAEEKQAKHQAKMEVIKNDADWESKMADASASSWKDEFWTVVLSIPVFNPSPPVTDSNIFVIPGNEDSAAFKLTLNPSFS